MTSRWIFFHFSKNDDNNNVCFKYWEEGDGDGEKNDQTEIWTHCYGFANKIGLTHASLLIASFQFDLYRSKMMRRCVAVWAELSRKSYLRISRTISPHPCPYMHVSFFKIHSVHSVRFDVQANVLQQLIEWNVSKQRK